MAYGHAERNLALICRLEAETRQLLQSLNQPDAEQSAWLQDSLLAAPPQQMSDERERQTTGVDQAGQRPDSPQGAKTMTDLPSA
jgi:hypothetical protein